MPPSSRPPRNAPPPRRKKRRPGFRAYLRGRFQALKRLIKKLLLPALALVALLLVWFFLTLPSIDKLNQSTRAPSVLFKSEEGQIVGSYGNIYGEYLPLAALPKALSQAVLATEDRKFYHHFGVDPMGLGRALFVNLRSHQAVQGGSTITQQVAKNVFLTPERTLTRKLREMLLAFSLERHYSKNDILTIYLNRVYLGAGSYGVDAAAHRYFGKSARDLSLSECAILAGLLKAPSRYAPTANPELSRKRAEQVLLNMQDAGYLNDKQVAAAKAELALTIRKTTRATSESNLYFTDWVADQLPETIGAVSEDLVVTVTLKPALQKAAEQSLSAVLDKNAEAMHATQGALVAMTPDGAVRALVGGRDYSQSPYNRAVQARRQPGSSFKLFVYLAGLEAGLMPNSTVTDQPVKIGRWQPKNYSGGYKGEMQLKDAVAQSINTVAVQVAQQAGLSRVVDVAHRLGVTSELEAVPSLALGSSEVSLMEMTAAYAHLANEGQRVMPYGIQRIATAGGRVLYERRAPGSVQVLNTGVVGMMNRMLEGVMTTGTGRAAQIGRPAAGKTGTTSDYRDAWFMGYTPDLACGVWVGNDDNTPMKKVTGGTLPAPIWRDFMKIALAKTPARELPVSDGFWQSLLPWQGGGEEAAPPPAATEQPSKEWHDEEAAPEAEPEEPPPAAQEKGEDAEVNLGPEFWHKLYGNAPKGTP